MGPYFRLREAAAAANWLISTHKFVGGGPGRIPLRGSELTEIISLDEDIYNARNSYISHATKNIDYLTHPLSFDLVKVEASYLFVSVNALIKL